MPTVSVVMPLYNKEPYIEQAIRSVQSQTLSDFELLVVDNASTDDSRAVAARCADDDARVKLFDEPQKGAAAARNRALDAAQGEFVAFLDADDFIEPTLLEKTVAKAQSTQADIVCFGHDLYYDDRSVYLHAVFPQGPDSFIPAELGGHLLFSGSPNACTKLFRRSFIESRKQRFDTTFATAEDMLFTYTLMMNASRIATVGELLYHYRQEVEGSLTNRKESRGVQSFDCLERLLSVANETPYGQQFCEGILNLSLDQARYLMQIACNAQEFIEQYDMYFTQWLPRIDAIADRVYPEVRYLYDRYKSVSSPIELMYVNWQEILDILKHVESDHGALVRDSAIRENELSAKIAEIEGSTTYRAGRAIMALPCALKDRLRS